MQSLPLRKLLQLMYADERLRTKKLREDILNDIRRQGGESSGGPDFYGPFWRSAKDHVFGLHDLNEAVERHIQVNGRRRNLYPRLRDGFLLWWNERRRWTNHPFIEANIIRGRYHNDSIGVTAKIDNVLCVRDGRGDDHFIYPYFCPEPVLSEQAARIGLWILCQAFPHIRPSELRILDVIRGMNFSLEASPLRGDEQELFETRIEWLKGEWQRLRAEYD